MTARAKTKALVIKNDDHTVFLMTLLGVVAVALLAVSI